MGHSTALLAREGLPLPAVTIAILPDGVAAPAATSAMPERRPSLRQRPREG